MSLKNGIGYHRRCLQCHAKQSLEGARKQLERHRAPENACAALGYLEAATEVLLDPAVVWALCAVHRREQRAARAAKDRAFEARVDAEQRAWAEGVLEQAASEGLVRKVT
jgi:hypothetical protein